MAKNKKPNRKKNPFTSPKKRNALDLLGTLHSDYELELTDELISELERTHEIPRADLEHFRDMGAKWNKARKSFTFDAEPI
jgi:hypothetical protein